MHQIDPNHVTFYHRSRPRLEQFVLWATTVPTKNAHRMAQANHRLLVDLAFTYGELSPFEVVREAIRAGRLHFFLEKHRIGQYCRIERCWQELTRVSLTDEIRRDKRGEQIVVTNAVNLRSVEELEQVHGIGMKTARFIVLHNVEGAHYAVLDTHLMKELRLLGYPVMVATKEVDGKLVTTVPLTRERYLRYEQWVLKEAGKAGLTPADYDLSVWKKWSQKGVAA